MKGTIMSPNYPKLYDANETCSYSIEVDEGHVVQLKFHDLDLVVPEGRACSENNITYVKVYDGPSPAYPTLTKLCGKPAPNETFVSTYNHMFVEMVAMEYYGMLAKGFLAKYKKV